MKTVLLAVVLTGLALSGCIHHTVEVEKPIRVEAYIKIDVDVRLQKEFENLFAFEKSPTPMTTTEPAGAVRGAGEENAGK